MTQRTLLLVGALLSASTACGPAPEACARQCGEIRELFEAPCGSQHTGTPAECAPWVGKVSAMAKELDNSLQGKPVEPGVREALPKLITAVSDFQSQNCGDVKVDNVASTEQRQSKCNEALIATRGDLGSLYFTAQVPD
ncbi:hypothetical protein Lesp02_79280 [Lentzea sp. NBRC 105346]|uniref:hypothetical protein n=1 Tax=Lentzea sp. NBRC 105346 TaxID=3032205 RepID=UPI0024A4B29C|nr:hypothetical protein [Lentzea sp. NBRC 105346]GLZ35741.1 hypothetical protein Lesp02_79280 [Lentzea sp. NBRC 105346]